jgi:methylenetetrahydrofolate reductase (NADPH)
MSSAVLSSLEHEQKAIAAELLRHSSIELTTNGRDTIMAAADLLPPGMSVYVPKLPRQTLEDKLVQIAMLREFGLEPIPHIAARQLSSELELRRFIEAAVQDSQVHRALVIGGDNPESSGPFSDSASVIASGILKAAGISIIDVTGYPERHPRIPNSALEADLDLKMQLAGDQNLHINIVTQFTFSPSKMVRYCNWLANKAPGVPVIAGMAGPTSTARLLNYARICGVSTSLRAMSSLGMNAVKLAMHSSPDKQFSVLRTHKSRGETGNLAGVHLFSFGGFVDSAQWLNRLASESAG